MPLLANHHHLETGPVRLEGRLAVSELDLEGADEMIQLSEPLEYDLEVQKAGQSIVARGELGLTLNCECVRCLKPFQFRLELKDWACDLSLEGEEKVLAANDCVDLTPAVREDILLGLPQHPLCKPGCGGLPVKTARKKKNTGDAGQTKADLAAWAELNKLKF